MKWPRGKYNGRRIVGVSMKIQIIVDYWGFGFQWNIGTKHIHVGAVLIHFETVYSVR